MSELLDEHGVLDAIENQKSWEELGFIKAGSEETIFIVSREDGCVARGATGILAFANTQNDAVYRLGRWEEEQAQAKTMYALQAENVRLREQTGVLAAALEEANGIIEWMSGSDDFGPSGQAHFGWLNAREKYLKSRAALRAYREGRDE